LACTSTDAPACCRIFNLIRFADSLAISASLTRDSAERNSSDRVEFVLIAMPTLDWNAPITPRWAVKSVSFLLSGASAWRAFARVASEKGRIG